MDLKLQDKVVVISGSTGGVGEALVKAFYAEGSKLAISSTSQEKLDVLMGKLDIASDRLFTYVMDVTKEAEVEAFISKAAEHFGTIDILVPNHGWEGPSARITEMDSAAFMRTFDINVNGVMYMIKYAAPYMIEKAEGAIVTIASNGSYTGSPTMSAYATSKHAVGGLMKTAALELGPMGIHCNFVCPGAIETPMILRIESNRNTGPDRTAIIEQFSSMYLDKRYCTAEEVANLTLYLASPLASHIMGSGIRLDGGLDAKD